MSIVISSALIKICFVSDKSSKSILTLLSMFSPCLVQLVDYHTSLSTPIQNTSGVHVKPHLNNSLIIFHLIYQKEQQTFPLIKAWSCEDWEVHLNGSKLYNHLWAESPIEVQGKGRVVHGISAPSRLCSLRLGWTQGPWFDLCSLES